MFEFERPIGKKLKKLHTTDDKPEKEIENDSMEKQDYQQLCSAFSQGKNSY